MSEAAAAVPPAAGSKQLGSYRGIGKLIVFTLMILAYGTVPHEWIVARYNDLDDSRRLAAALVAMSG